MPDDVEIALDDAGVRDEYDQRPPYQRNDYIGWIGRAKRPETRQRRIDQMIDELKAGDSYMKMPWSGRRSG
ncbi:MAG: YdeI/OmpD-associated family protein [Acidimicrobiia bacterium]|nr:YdeI/OmpD-associated family protein [Acidimicrobiia bacterium]